jgi:hypothetical protein
MSDGGKVLFVIGQDEKKLAFNVSVAEGAAAAVRADFRPAVADEAEYRYDSGTQILAISQKNSKLVIAVDEREGRYPIRRWTLTGKEGSSLTAGHFGLNGSSVRKIIGITAGDFRKAGMSLKTVSVADFNAALSAGAQQFPRTAKEVKLAESLLSVFPSDEAAQTLRNHDDAGYRILEVLASEAVGSRQQE